MPRLRDEKGWLKPGPHCYDDLLRYESVNNFLSMYQSKKTKDDYMRYLFILTEESNLSPDELLNLDKKQAREVLMKVVRKYLNEGKITSARIMQGVIKAFYECNDKEIELKRVDRIKKMRKKIAIEYVPTKEDAYKMADIFYRSNKRDLRNRAIILCLFQSGVRVGCLINWKVSMVKNQLYPEIKTPVMLKITNAVDTKLNGYGLGYYITYLGIDAARALRKYLDYRKKEEGDLDVQDYIFKSVMKNNNKEKTNRIRILEFVKLAAKKADLDPSSVWTHSLRKSFRKVLNSSRMDEDTKEALMGHRLPGSRENYFDYHDEDEIATKYMSADFSLHSPQARLTKLEGEKVKLERELKEKTDLIDGLTKRISDLETIYMKRIRVEE